MNLTRTHDPDIILSVLMHPSIWKHIGGKDDFEPPIGEDFHYLLIEDGNEIAGLFILHPDDHGLKIHANMIVRGHVAKDAAEAALEYGFNHSDVIYAEIPEEFENVVTFASYFLKPVSTEGGVHKLQLTKNEWLGG